MGRARRDPIDKLRAETKIMNEVVKPLAYRPAAAAAVLGVSRSTIYEMIANGEIESRKLGAATLIRHDELMRVLDGAALSPATKAAQASIR